MWYDMVFLAPLFPSSAPAWSPSCPWFHAMSTTPPPGRSSERWLLLYYLVTESKLLYLHIDQCHIIITCPLQNKVRRLYFIYCKFYVVARAFALEPFLNYELSNHNMNPTVVSITPLSGPSVVNAISTIEWETDTRWPLIRYKPYVERGTSLAHEYA